MCRIFVLLLLMLFISPLGAEEIGQIVFPRKAGRIELSIGGGYGYAGVSGSGMSGDEMEMYLLGTSSLQYMSGAESLSGGAIRFNAGLNYFLGRNFALYGNLAFSKRQYKAVWEAMNPSYSDAEYKFDVSYLELSLGPKLFFGDFYFGVDGYIAIPVANSYEFTASPRRETGSFTADQMNVDYGINFRLGWVKRFTEDFSMDVSIEIQKSMTELAVGTVGEPISAVEKGGSISFLLSFNWAIN